MRNSSTGFFDDVQRGFDQKALFTSVDFDIIPKVLTLTGGTRYFHFDDHVAGGDVGSFYCKFYGGYSTTNFSPCSSSNNNGFNANFYPGPPGSISGYHPGPYGYDFNASSTNHTTENGFRSRGNLTWKITDGVMVYYTYSEGYRPGGFNRDVYKRQEFYLDAERSAQRAAEYAAQGFTGLKFDPTGGFSAYDCLLYTSRCV